MTHDAAKHDDGVRARGRVVRADAKVFHVDVDGRVLYAAPRGKLFEELGGRKNPVAVGDLVELDLATEPTTNRRSTLATSTCSRGSRAEAARPR